MAVCSVQIDGLNCIACFRERMQAAKKYEVCRTVLMGVSNWSTRGSRPIVTNSVKKTERHFQSP